MLNSADTADYFLSLGVIFIIDTYKETPNDFKIGVTILNQIKWYRGLGLETPVLKAHLTKALGRYQGKDSQSLQSAFETLIQQTQTQVASIHYITLSHLLQALVEINPTRAYQSQLYAHFLEVFAFLSFDDKSPMNNLDFEAFCNYIEALMIYASVDNKGFTLHQNEALLILNEIKSYVENKPLKDTQSSDLFFALIKRAEENTKNHLSTRFEGVVKSAFKAMDDTQDDYFIQTLQSLSQSDGVYSTQEKLFDNLIESAKQKVASFENKEREGNALYKTLLQTVPFKAKEDNPDIAKMLSKDSLQNVVYVWKMVQKIIARTYAKYHIMDVDQKTFFFLLKANDISQEEYDYLITMRNFVKRAGFVNFNRLEGEKVVKKLMMIYNHFLHLKRKRA